MSRAEDRENRRRTGFALTLPLLAGLLFIAALTPGPLLARADAGKAPRRSNRCLLVVETSRAMQRQSGAVLQIVQDMLRSGLGGQLRDGDTLGVWTYNENLYAGRFPLQTWSPEAQKDITRRVLTFLKDQKYEPQASFDIVLPALSRLIKDSSLITIILISSADEKPRGTRFDYPSNQAYENQKWRDEQGKARMPLVTVLRAQDGQLGDFTANTPQERQRAETIQTKLLEAVRNSPPTTAPPMVLSGKKAQPEEAPAPKPTPAGVNVQPPIPAPEAARANKPLTVKPPERAGQPAHITTAETAPIVPDKHSVDMSPRPSPAPKPVPEPKAEVVKAPETKPIAPALPTPETASALPARTPEPKPAAVELPKPAPASESKPVTEPKAEVVKASETKPIAPALPTPETASALLPRMPEPKPAAVESPKPAPSPESKPAPVPKPVTERKAEVVKAPEAKPAAPSKADAALALPTPAPKPAPAPSAAREVSSGTSPNATKPATTPPDSSILSPRSSPLPVPPGQTATAVPAETLARNRSIWIAGLLLAGAALSLALLLLRRSRATAGASLITRSFERKHKP